MTFSIDGTDIGQIIEIVTWVVTSVVMLLAGIAVYLMVRPPREVRGRREAPPSIDTAEAEELWQLVDRMEARLAVLERALAAEEAGRPRLIAEKDERDFAPAGEGRDSGRKE